MASFCNFYFLFLSSTIFFIALSTATSPKALMLTVIKDKCSHQYVTQISQRTPLVPLKLTVDLGGRFMWVDCDSYISSSYRPVTCNSTICAIADTNSCGVCGSDSEPGCVDTCSHSPDNPIIRLGTIGDVAQDVVSLRSFNGKNLGMNVSVPNVPFVCGRGMLLENLADGVTGMAGLGRNNISLPVYFSSALGFPRKFEMCLSSLTNSSGVILFGEGLYSNHLNYTPLIRNPVSTAGSYFQGEPSTDYFIGVKSIRIDGKEIKLNKTLLSIDGEGNGGTKISTVHPYTILHTSIYKAVVRTFIKQMEARAFMRVEPPIAPFGACYQYSEQYDVDEHGVKVPPIDLVMEEGQGNSSIYWRIWGANSMVRITSFTMCLGFVDGGPEPRTSIVIGGRQVEDNLLQFDNVNSRLGFSSYLVSKNITCSKLYV